MEKSQKSPISSLAQPRSAVEAGSRRRRWPCCIALLMMCLAGCGDKMASVSGVVRLDGRPLAAAGVAFHAVAGGAVASSTTDVKGRYQLETGSREGMAPGEYRVTVCKDEVVAGMNAEHVVASGGLKMNRLVPPIYGGPTTSPLRVAVSRGRQTQDFDLTSGLAMPVP